MRQRRAFLVLAAALTASPVLAAGGGLGRGSRGGPTDDFGIEFVRIGRPGNRAALPEERFYNQRFENLGRVNYRYRISKTEVTAEQWLPFVNAYWPTWEAMGGHPASSHLTGGWINTTTNQPGVDPGYYIAPGTDRFAVEVSWRVAAAFTNWMHNGQVNESWAFQSGAYDTSTFGGNSQDGYTDQAERSPGARFWIPGVDEWTKAAHYDPDRYGEGIEGYWLRMGSQNDPLTPGLPENGGQTNGGDFLPGFEEQFMGVGSYTDVGGPWGVLDTSGGVREWSETIWSTSDTSDTHSGLRYVRGSLAGSTSFANHDLIDWYATVGGPGTGLYGIRLASAIPATAAPCVTLIATGLAIVRRRR